MPWYLLLEIESSSFLVGLVPCCLHTILRPEHHAIGQLFSFRPLYGSRREELAFCGWSSKRSHIVLRVLAVDMW